MVNIEHNHFHYSVAGSAFVEKMQNKVVQDSNIATYNGRTYQYLTIDKTLHFFDGLREVANLVLNIVQNKLSKEGITKTWNDIVSGKMTYKVAIDLTGEDRVSKVALKMGLMPQLIENSDESYPWMTAAIGDSELLADLTTEIRSRQQEINDKKELFRSKMNEDRSHEEVQNQVQDIAKEGKLDALSGGSGGAYLLKDANNTPRFVVKPNDEDILCLNNRKKCASPLVDSQLRIRADIPTYESAQNEALASDIADLVGLNQIAPKTVLVILENDSFHLFTDQVSGPFKEDLIPEKGKEKLCSAQEFIPNSEDLLDYTKRMSAARTPCQFDQSDFEMANIFTWITGDQDGHSGNYRTYEKENRVQGLKKIDNGLICGEGNQNNYIVNGLATFKEEMNQPLSEEGRKLIADIPLEKIQDKMRFYEKSEASIQLLQKRVETLKALVQGNSEITLAEINKNLIVVNR
jgi:hypothetical protein